MLNHSQNIDFLFEILSKIVAKELEIAFSKLHPVCQTDENRLKPGSYLNNADKRVAKPSRAEFLLVH